MADEEKVDGTKGDGGAGGQGSSDKDKKTDDGKADDEVFDEARARQTIKEQRASEAEAKRKLKDAERELETLRNEKAQRERAEMSELDQVKADLAAANTKIQTLETERDDLKAAHQAEKLDNAIRLQATRDGTRFTDPDDAVQFISREGLVDDDGNVKTDAVETALKAVLSKKAYLAAGKADGDGKSHDRVPGPGELAADAKGDQGKDTNDGADEDRPMRRYG